MKYIIRSVNNLKRSLTKNLSRKAMLILDYPKIPMDYEKFVKKE